jgi:hypothetical protein
MPDLPSVLRVVAGTRHGLDVGDRIRTVVAINHSSPAVVLASEACVHLIFLFSR